MVNFVCVYARVAAAMQTVRCARLVDHAPVVMCLQYRDAARYRLEARGLRGWTWNSNVLNDTWRNHAELPNTPEGAG